MIENKSDLVEKKQKKHQRVFILGVTDVDAYVFIEEVYVFIYENQFSSV